MEPDATVPPSPVEPIAPDASNLGLGVLAGLVAGGIGAAAWAVITVATNLQIGWMAVAVGALVGLAVRKAGRGRGTAFGIAGASLSLVACLCGNLMTVCILIARERKVALLDVLSGLDPATAVNLLGATFSGMDLLFYALAVYEGYRFSMATPPASA